MGNPTSTIVVEGSNAHTAMHTATVLVDANQTDVGPALEPLRLPTPFRPLRFSFPHPDVDVGPVDGYTVR